LLYVASLRSSPPIGPGGYSRLMGADEEGTHERLKRHLRELVDPKIEEHRGRTVKNTGDGFLAEFASVVRRGRRLR
jgi:class 3 adenylate cyclase